MQDVNKLATSDGGEGENAVLLLIFLWVGSEQVTPERATLTRGLLCAHGTQDPADSGKAFYFPLTS